jgi:hypothetical protein
VRRQWTTEVASTEDLVRILTKLSACGYTVHGVVGRPDGCFHVIAFKDEAVAS